MKKKKETSNKKKRGKQRLDKTAEFFPDIYHNLFCGATQFYPWGPLTHWLKMASNFRYGSINNSQYMNNYSAKKK